MRPTATPRTKSTHRRPRRSHTGSYVKVRRQNEQFHLLGYPVRIIFVILNVFPAIAVNVLNRDTGFLWV